MYDSVLEDGYLILLLNECLVFKAYGMKKSRNIFQTVSILLIFTVNCFVVLMMFYQHAML